MGWWGSEKKCYTLTIISKQKFHNDPIYAYSVFCKKKIGDECRGKKNNKQISCANTRRHTQTNSLNNQKAIFFVFFFFY